MDFFEAAYREVCRESREAGGAYVSLYRKDSYYGGPEEGGWWGSDYELVRTQRFASEELAEQAAERVRQLASEMTADAKRMWSEHCRQQTDWCEARGLDADWLPEPDGPTEYVVVVEEVAGQCASRGSRTYE
jgi:hypothetical protein